MTHFTSAALVLAAALGAEAPTSEVSEVARELLRLEAASLEGTADAARIDYAARSRERPADPMPRIALAWLTLPSDDAWNQLKAVATIYPDNPWVHYGMGRIYATWKMKDQARAEVLLVLTKQPRFFPAVTVLGDLFLAEGDAAKAEAEYRRALALGDDPRARTGLGLALLAQGKQPEALESLKASVRTFPQQPAALAALIPLLIDAKDPAALEVAQAAAALRPKDREARRVLAQLRFDAGDKVGAAKEYDRLAALGNPAPATLERLAGLYRELDAGMDEERILVVRLAADPSDPAPCLRLAELRLARQDVPGAEAALEQALERDPKLKGPHLTLAKLALDRGRSTQALRHYRAARELDPDDAEAKEKVARLESEFKLPKRPLKGNVNGVYWAVRSSLDKLAFARRAYKPSLAGRLKVRLEIGPAGRVTALEIVEDSLQDSVMLGHVYFSLIDAQYHEKKVQPVIEFVLGKRR